MKGELAEIRKKYEDCLRISSSRTTENEVGTRSPLAKLELALKATIDDFNANRFRPNSEADVTACLYHKWLEQNPSDLGLLHVEARIGQIQTNLHSDIAYGKTENNNEGRPSIVQPLLLSEVKSFWGLTKGQLSTRRAGIVEDIVALGKESLDSAVKALIVIDMLPTKNYLSDEYNEKFSELIKQQGNKISTLIVRFKEGSASLLPGFV